MKIAKEIKILVVRESQDPDALKKALTSIEKQFGSSKGTGKKNDGPFFAKYSDGKPFNALGSGISNLPDLNRERESQQKALSQLANRDTRVANKVKETIKKHLLELDAMEDAFKKSESLWQEPKSNWKPQNAIWAYKEGDKQGFVTSLSKGYDKYQWEVFNSHGKSLDKGMEKSLPLAKKAVFGVLGVEVEEAKIDKKQALINFIQSQTNYDITPFISDDSNKKFLSVRLEEMPDIAQRRIKSLAHSYDKQKFSLQDNGGYGTAFMYGATLGESLNKKDLSALIEEIVASYTKEEMAEFKDFKDFFDSEDVRNAYEEDWEDEKDYWEDYLKEVWKMYKAGKLDDQLG